MFYLVGISVQQDKLVCFIKDDVDGSIEAVTKSDMKFALKNGVDIKGIDIVDGKEQIIETYFEKDIYLLNDTEKLAIQSVISASNAPFEIKDIEYSHFMNENTGELLKMTEGLHQIENYSKNNQLSGDTIGLTEEEKGSLDKLCSKFGVSFVDNNELDLLGGLDSLDGLDSLSSDVDEYGVVEDTPLESEEPVEEDHDHDHEDAIEEEEETVVAKLYAQLDDEQNAILRRYYLWYSQRVFEIAGLKGTNTNIHQNTKRMQIKRDAIAKLKQAGGTWVYAGFIDAGRQGIRRCEHGHIIPEGSDTCAEGHPVYFNARCTFKHKLRYMHIAWNVEKAEIEKVFFGDRYDKKIEQVLHDNADASIIFGIACIGDFFDIDSTYRNMLQSTQRITLKDMEQIYAYYEQNNVAEVNNSFTVMDDLMTYVKKNLAQSSLLGKPSVLDSGTTQFYLQSRKAGLIPPKSLVQMVRDSIIGWDINASKGHKFSGWLGTIDVEFFRTVMNTIFHAEFNDLINLAFSIHHYDSITPYKYVRLEQIVENTKYNDNDRNKRALRCYMETYFKYEVCGDFYKYRATDTSKDEGGASSITRTAIERIYSSIKAYLWNDVTYSVEYLRKINEFYKVASSIDLYAFLETPYQIETKDDGTAVIDFNNVNIDTGKIRLYSDENDSKLYTAFEAFANYQYIKGYYPSYRSGIRYTNYSIDEAIQLLKDHASVIQTESEAYKTWAIEKLNQRVIDRNNLLEKEREQKRIEEEIRERETKAKEIARADRLTELKSKDASKLSNAELMEVLKETDTSGFSDKQKGILQSAMGWRDLSKLTPNMLYRLREMFNQVYHPNAVTENTNTATELSDNPRMQEALEYARKNKAEFIGKKGISDFNIDTIAKSVLKYGHYTEKQKRFIEPILERYEELGK